ncbi:UDP-N-acetylglucosamine 4,6-dehydratase [hydrothermal vent metagenome]|uniref:UDP-N-acetylglucosamine 4,6-dehydratase n=1 Tax=hydrothermal vent metagenome TaxID=652676 RepID=A0A3B0YNU7_9ZZZZ
MNRIINLVKTTGFAFFHDLLMIPTAWLFAYWLRFNLGVIPESYLITGLYALIVIIPLQAVAFRYLGLYRGIWRFASIPDLMRIIKASLIGVCLAIVVMFSISSLDNIPRSVPVIYLILLVLFLSGPRFVYRWFKDYRKGTQSGRNVLIVGAGSAAEMLVRDLGKDLSQGYKPVAFVDDNPRQKGKEIHGIRVLGSTRRIPEIIKEMNIAIVMLAIPSATTKQMRRIVRVCSKLDIPFRTLPRMQDLVSGESVLQELREVSIEDLLGREQVHLDQDNIRRGIRGRTIMVSGAGGSIGSELVRQICQYAPNELVLVDNTEFNLFKIEQEVLSQYPELSISLRLVDVTDAVAVNYMMSICRPDTIYHAAAYKHVPLLEEQIRQATRNNIVGTNTIAQAADKYGVQEFVLVSTDKAVNPSNVMGTTKRVSELICQSLNNHSNTRFITVRFGNVLDSAGSVVPLFRKQIKAGGPVTVTDPEITRFFMTIPEACQLIMQSATMGKGGEIFILDMGDPVKIDDLAKQMIVLSGKKPNIDIDIEYTGLRPGEKMYEELSHEKECLQSTSHLKITLANSREVSAEWLLNLIQQLEAAIALYDEVELKNLLRNLVPEYRQYSHDMENVIPFASTEALSDL